VRRAIIPDWPPAVPVLFVLPGSPARLLESQDLVELVTMRDGTNRKAHVRFPEGLYPWSLVLLGRLCAWSRRRFSEQQQ
jgi:hypothetical protein